MDGKGEYYKLISIQFCNRAMTVSFDVIVSWNSKFKVVGDDYTIQERLFCFTKTSRTKERQNKNNIISPPLFYTFSYE